MRNSRKDKFSDFYSLQSSSNEYTITIRGTIINLKKVEN